MMLRFGCLKSGLAALVAVALVLAACADSSDSSDSSNSSDSADPLERGRSLIEAGRLDEAVDALEVAIREAPGEPEPLYLYGMAQLMSARPSLALLPLRAARDHPDWEARAEIALMRVGKASTNYDFAIDAATRILERDPAESSARQLRAEIYITTRAFEEALEDADILVEANPDDVGAQALRLEALMGLERIDEIEAEFDDIEALTESDSFPKSIAQHLCTARAVFASEKNAVEEAHSRFEDCLERYPNRRTLMHAAIKFFDEQGTPDRGTQILREGLEHDPSALDLRTSLATRLRSLGDDDAATELLVEATKAPGPIPPRAWSALALHYFAIERFDDSVSAWEQAIEAGDELDPAFRFAYAEALINAGRYDETEAVARELPQSMRELVRALTLLERGEPEQALAHFDAGQRLWPNNAVARYFAGLAAERAFEIDRAVEEFRQSLRVKAEETPAALNLARIYLAEGELEMARTAIVRFVQTHPSDVEGKLMSIEVAAQLRGLIAIEHGFTADTWPHGQRGPVVGRLAEIANSIGGPQAVQRFLTIAGREHPDLVTHPDVVRARVRALAALGQVEEAREAIERARAALPDTAAWYEIEADLLARSDGEESAVRRAHERALELDPSHARSLAALADLALERGSHEEARQLFERAASADPRDFLSRLRGAELAAEAGDVSVAIQRLEALLADSPVEAAAAVRLAELTLDSGGDAARALRIARASARFQGGPEARALLQRAELAAGNGR
jgi:tetratricopeptide (TPR) repeat protein